MTRRHSISPLSDLLMLVASAVFQRSTLIPFSHIKTPAFSIWQSAQQRCNPALGVHPFKAFGESYPSSDIHLMHTGHRGYFHFLFFIITQSVFFNRTQLFSGAQERHIQESPEPFGLPNSVNTGRQVTNSSI